MKTLNSLLEIREEGGGFSFAQKRKEKFYLTVAGLLTRKDVDKAWFSLPVLEKK